MPDNLDDVILQLKITKPKGQKGEKSTSAVFFTLHLVTTTVLMQKVTALKRYLSALKIIFSITTTGKAIASDKLFYAE